jgi:hypothetical protein
MILVYSIDLGCYLESVIRSENIASLAFSFAIRFRWTEMLDENGVPDDSSEWLAGMQNVRADGSELILVWSPFSTGQKGPTGADLEIVASKWPFASAKCFNRISHMTRPITYPALEKLAEKFFLYGVLSFELR